MQPIADVVDEGRWALKQERDRTFVERDFTFRATPNGPPLNLTQRIAFLTPNFVRVDSVTKVEWRSVYLPRELPPEAIRDALNQHPDFQEQPGMTEAPPIRQPLRYPHFFPPPGLYDIPNAE